MSDELAQAKVGNLGQLLLRVARLYNERAVSKFQTIEPRFTIAHTTVMPHLDLEGTRPSELARRMGTSKQAAGQLVKELEKMGVVTRVPDPTDGRARLVVFTQQGMESLVQGLGVLKAVETEVAQAVGEASIARLKSELEVMLAHLEQLTPQTPDADS